MKKIILILCLTLGLSQASIAQLDFGVKGGLNYNSNSIKEVQSDVFSGAKSKTGYHAGAWLRFKLPIIGFYVRPELVYTNLENEVFYKSKETHLLLPKNRYSCFIGKENFWDWQYFYWPFISIYFSF